MKVLIADDSAEVRKRLQLVLSAVERIEAVVEARDGAEAIDLVERHRPDAVILDIRMPKKSGIDVLRALRRRRTPAGVVIMLTNYPDPQYREACRQLGAGYFLDKTIECDRIVDVLRAQGEAAANAHVHATKTP